MRATVLLFLAALLAALPAAAHPGTLSADGCHVCRKRCARFGLADGQRHCHPERAGEAQGAAGTGRRAAGGGDGAPAGAAAAGESRAVTITRVADGDTFTVRDARGEEKVRVLGIDCPESARNAKCERDGRQGRHDCDWQVPRGVEAKRIARALLDGQAVTLEGPFSRDPFGRLLAYVRMADGQDYGLKMVREGRCEDFGWKYPHPRSAQYRSATPAP